MANLAAEHPGEEAIEVLKHRGQTRAGKPQRNPPFDRCIEVNAGVFVAPAIVPVLDAVIHEAKALSAHGADEGQVKAGNPSAIGLHRNLFLQVEVVFSGHLVRDQPHFGFLRGFGLRGGADESIGNPRDVEAILAGGQDVEGIDGEVTGDVDKLNSPDEGGVKIPARHDMPADAFAAYVLECVCNGDRGRGDGDPSSTEVGAPLFVYREGCAGDVWLAGGGFLRA